MTEQRSQRNLFLPAAPTTERGNKSNYMLAVKPYPNMASSGKVCRPRTGKTFFRAPTGELWVHSGNAAKVLRLLATHPGGITQFSTLPWHTRLAASIQILRLSGIAIETVREGPSRHARYYLLTRGELLAQEGEGVL
jgi:hypothetical protein